MLPRRRSSGPRSRGLTSIATPAVSTGVFGYPVDEAAQRRAGDGCLSWRPGLRTVRLVRFVLWDERDLDDPRDGPGGARRVKRGASSWDVSCCSARSRAATTTKSRPPRRRPTSDRRPRRRRRRARVEGATTGAARARQRTGRSRSIDVRQTDEGCPRIVFEFKDSVPGLQGRVQASPRSPSAARGPRSTRRRGTRTRSSTCGSSRPGARTSKDEGEPYYKGPRDIAVDGAVLKHLKVICDFEGVFEWVIGLDAEHAVRRRTPSRIRRDS